MKKILFLFLLIPVLSFGQIWTIPYYPANASCVPELDYFDNVAQTPNTYMKFNLEFSNVTGPQLIDGYDLQYPLTPWGPNGWMLIVRRKDSNGEIGPLNVDYIYQPLPGQERGGAYVNTPYEHNSYEFQFQHTNFMTGAVIDYYKYFYSTDSIDIKSIFPDHNSSHEYVITLATATQSVIGGPPTYNSCFDMDLPTIGVYQGVDTDGDGIVDLEDNCVNTSNSDQSDNDGDGIGDVCDNCPNNSNINQEDNDNDGLGDICDDDDDNDGVLDTNDNCPLIANADQADADNDGVGDLCDDEDGDGIIDVNDNCPETANADQADADSDGVGDVCDNCEDTINADQADNDGDTIGNVCDNCPNNSNSSQTDSDGDGIGNACDNDLDGDGVNNSVDNCPNDYNPDQADVDNDGLGDACDDTDDSAIPNLRVSGFSVNVDGTTYNAANTLPIFKKGGEHVFNITFENNDDGLAENVSFRIIVSTSQNAYPNITSTPVYQYWNNFNAVGDINGNSEATFTFSDYIYDSISTLQLAENTDFYMFVHVDYDEDIEETNESDNVTPVRFRWDDPNTAGRVAYLDLGNGLIEIPLDEGLIFQNTRRVYNLKIYSLSVNSLPVINQTIGENQTVDVSGLPNGTYVVHINDIYVKKFAKGKKVLIMK